MFSSIGGLEILVILVVALLVLGPDHLPRVMRTAGKTFGQLRRMSTEFQRTMNAELALEEQPQKVEAKPKPEGTPEAAGVAESAPATGMPGDDAKAARSRTTRRAGIKKKKHTALPEATERAMAEPSADAHAVPVDERLQAIKESGDFIAAPTPPEPETAAKETPRRPRRAAAKPKPKPALRTRQTAARSDTPAEQDATLHRDGADS